MLNKTLTMSKDANFISVHLSFRKYEWALQVFLLKVFPGGSVVKQTNKQKTNKKKTARTYQQIQTSGFKIRIQKTVAILYTKQNV